MTRRVLIILAALSLVAGACGDDTDDDADAAGGDTTTQDGGAPAMGPAELEAHDQAGDGTSLMVASVTLPADGFLVVHADAGGSPGPVIGHSDLLPEGESTNVTVPFDEPLAGSATVWPMAHIDTNTNGAYDFAPPDVTDDGPATLDSGEVAVLPIEYTLDGSDGGGGDGGGSAAVTVVDFAFDPATIEVEAGTAITWTNEDGVPHTVTAGAPGDTAGTFDESLDAGGTAEITFDDAGTHPYFCSIHTNMTGEVVVS